jgi:cell division protein FtsN
LGLAAGLGIAFLIALYLQKNTPQERPGMRAPNLPIFIKPGTTPTDADATAPAERLDLNKPLQSKQPATSTADPIADLANGKKPPEAPPTSVAPIKPEAVYYLQIGAFTKRADADAEKASLAIQGIQSQLSEVTSDGNTLWRVRAGPFESAEESNPVRDKLNGMGIKVTIIKANKS